MAAVGIDIGTYSIKAVQAKPGAKPTVQRVVDFFNSSGIGLPTDQLSADKLVPLVQSLFTDHKLDRKDVRLALPEQAVSTKVIAIPPLTDAELASAIGWQAEQHIPIPVEELSLEYQVLFRPDRKEKDQKMLVLLVGTRKAVVERYVDVFVMAGVEPTMVETQMISTTRSLGFTEADPTTMVVLMGATTMDMCIIHEGKITFVFSHLMGGQLLSKTIEQVVGLEAQQAEQYKRTYGLDENQLEGKIRQALLQPITVMVNEMKKAMQYFGNQYGGQGVSRVLLAGGSAQLPGLVQFVSGQLGVEVLIASPFATATGEVPTANQAAFSVCMGLVMKEQ